MKNLLLGLAVLPFLASVSMAGHPQALTDPQMDKVAAGFDFDEYDTSNGGQVRVLVNEPNLFPAGGGCPINPSTSCFLSISGTKYPSGVQSFQLYAVFGPGPSIITP
ncbi:MAG TPA: hypothetical protein VLX09_08390 [Stellaceae bacterium]|nr:hypothetical protein [Stellaceae bacterium]